MDWLNKRGAPRKRLGQTGPEWGGQTQRFAIPGKRPTQRRAFPHDGWQTAHFTAQPAIGLGIDIEAVRKRVESINGDQFRLSKPLVKCVSVTKGTSPTAVTHQAPLRVTHI